MTQLDERYGRTRTASKRRRWVAGSVAGVFVLVLGGWLLWAGLFAPAAQLDVQDTGYVVESDSLVSVRFQLTIEPGSSSTCAVQALDKSFGVIGWRIIHIPAAEQRVRVLASSVRTSQRAMTGLIYRCWPA